MTPKAKVGVLMDRLACSPHLHETVTRLAGDGRVELWLLRNRFDAPRGLARVAAKIRNVGLPRFISIVFFNTLESVERRIFRAASREVRSHLERRELDPGLFAGVLELQPIFSKTRITVTYPDADIEKIRALGLDLMLRGNGTGIFKGRILTASRLGILSFHHGDNRWNRGGPPGFWEVFLKKPGTGFIIQILNEKLDAGEVLFRGEAPTRRTYTENMASLFRAANPFMAKLILDFAATGALPDPLPKVPYSGTLLRTPRFTVTLRYILRTCALFLGLALRRKVLGLHQRWSVAFIRSDWRDASFSKAVIVRNPPGRFLADPFVASRDGQTAILVEDYHYATGVAAISAVRLRPEGGYDIVPDVLKEPFHLSFPYLFEHGGELYMIPESRQARAIRLYRCARFPDRWEYQMDLMKDVSAVDTMVFEHSGKWWLLTNISPDASGTHAVALHAFSAETPLTTEWRPHAGNPVRFSASRGRNGGLLRGPGGEIFRVRQRYAFNQYGAASSVARLERLDAEAFVERTYCEVEPHFMRGLSGTHHIHSDGKVTTFDFVREETLA